MVKKYNGWIADCDVFLWSRVFSLRRSSSDGVGCPGAILEESAADWRNEISEQNLSKKILALNLTLDSEYLIP